MDFVVELELEVLTYQQGQNSSGQDVLSDCLQSTDRRKQIAYRVKVVCMFRARSERRRLHSRYSPHGLCSEVRVPLRPS